MTILKKLNHKSIIRYHDSYFDSDSNTFWLLMEFFPAVTLLQLLKETQSPMSESQIKSIMHQLIEGVAYLHSLNICHRDLNLENILISLKDFSIRLIDFGISKCLDSENRIMLSPVGDANYRPPELLDGGSYSINSDVWQLGLIFAQIVKRKKLSTKKVIRNMEFLKNEILLSEYGRNLLLMMLEIDSIKRISCECALKLEWFKTMN